jgi:hypothetical protein
MNLGQEIPVARMTLYIKPARISMLNVNSMLLDDDPGPILEKPRWARHGRRHFYQSGRSRYPSELGDVRCVVGLVGSPTLWAGFSKGL